MSDQRHDTPPEIFGPYLVHERLGVGGMATVHRAKERGIEGFERVVALKRLLPHLAEDEQFVRAFVREAKLASMLAHTNIVQLFELGRVDHVYFISMELIEGRDLRQVLRQARRITGPPPTDVVVALLIQICDALAYAHTRCDDDGAPLGLVHRDVSPSNVLVTNNGHVKIIDFGIAKANTIHMRTATGRVKGKMAYMAPEATRGEQLDARSDIFSAGVIAHELLTARPLFATKNDYQTLMRVQNAPVPPPSTYNASCSPGLDAIVLKALAKSPDERYLSAAAMRDALDELRKKQQINASSREVSDWFQWAFALEQPEPTARTAARVTPPTLGAETRSSSRLSQSGAGLQTPPTGSMDYFHDSVPHMEADDEVIEIAWGGREDGAPVLLDDVPDRSGPMLFEDEDVEQPSQSPQMSLNPAASKGGTLLTYVPPPPKLGETSRTKERERSLAAGTAAPAAAAGFAMPTPLPDAEQEEVEADALAAFEARMRDELTGSQILPKATGTPAQKPNPMARAKFARASTPSLLLPIPVPVTASTTARVPALRAPTAEEAGAEEQPAPRARPAERQRSRRATTEFGAHIVEREGGRWVRRIALAAIILAAAAGVFALTRSSGKKAAAVDNATLKVVIEPPDATIEIKGQATYDHSPVRVKLAANSYTIEIRKVGYQSWTSTITMEKDETQTLRVALARAGTSEKARAVKTTEPSLAVEKAAPAGDADVDPAAERRRKRRRARRSEENVAVDDAPAREEVRSPAVLNTGSGSVVLTPLSVKGSEPPERVEKRGAMVVPPNAVRKRRGSAPRIRVRPGEPSPPSRVSARLCIDRRGKVSSAQVLTMVSSNVRSSVLTALRRWRYAPYRHKGERVDVCFAVSFKTR